MSRPSQLICLIAALGCGSDFDLHQIDKAAHAPGQKETALDASTENHGSESGEGSNAAHNDLTSEPPPEDDCENTSDLIYGVDRDTEVLYLYDPIENEFESLGQLNCGMWDGVPQSMGISRDGRAFLRYSSQTVFEVDLQTLDCYETDYGGDLGSFGMGYATLNADTWQDELFVASGHTLLKLNTNTWQNNTIGQLPSQAELTGNGEGELWAFLPLENPAKLIRLDKGNANSSLSYSLSNFPDPYSIDTFAFATWDKEFYLFVRSYGMGESTSVYRVDENGNMALVLADSGKNIVGAGVSTCAP